MNPSPVIAKETVVGWHRGSWWPLQTEWALWSCQLPRPPRKNETIKMSFLKKDRLCPCLDKASAHTFSLAGMWGARSQWPLLKAFCQMCEVLSLNSDWNCPIPPPNMLSQLKSLTRSNNQSYLNIILWITPSKTVSNSSLFRLSPDPLPPTHTHIRSQESSSFSLSHPSSPSKCQDDLESTSRFGIVTFP